MISSNFFCGEQKLSSTSDIASMTLEGLKEAPPKLTAGQCHLWHIALHGDSDGLAQYLSPDDKRRVLDFRSPATHRQFIVTRGALRKILGAYLGLDPKKVPIIESSRFCKPELSTSLANLRFNVSHSGQHAMIVLTRGAEAGVDIERWRPLTDAGIGARRIFCRQDMDHWQGLSKRFQALAFCLAWTRKEAISKALGCGLHCEFKDLRVSFNPGQAALFFGMPEKYGAAESWSLIDVKVSGAYCAAIAVANADITLTQYALNI